VCLECVHAQEEARVRAQEEGDERQVGISAVSSLQEAAVAVSMLGGPDGIRVPSPPSRTRRIW
jgi:hypothetical protein